MGSWLVLGSAFAPFVFLPGLIHIHKVIKYILSAGPEHFHCKKYLSVFSLVMISFITEQWNNTIFLFCLRKKLDLEGIVEISFSPLGKARLRDA